jgi:signal transduction histidine kinase
MTALLALALTLALALVLTLAHSLSLLPAMHAQTVALWASHLGLLASGWVLASWRGRQVRRQLQALKTSAAPTVARPDAAETLRAERRRLALDLHDGAIQPYIGLKLAVEALRLQAGAGHPLEAGLQRIVAMTEAVISDLRRRAQSLTQAPTSPLRCLRTELEHQARQMRDFHGLDIAVQTAQTPALSAQLHEEVSHLVREGLSNIRRHTQARSAEVRIDCKDGWLGICIANEAPAGVRPFTPRSITERARALGGRALVCTQVDGRTDVRVRLPV